MSTGEHQEHPGGPAAPDPTGRPADPGPEPVVVDARGLRCPLPVIRLAQRVRDLEAGTVVEVWATDPAAAADIPAWCRMRSQELVGSDQRDVGTEGAHTAYLVRVTAGA